MFDFPYRFNLRLLIVLAATLGLLSCASSPIQVTAPQPSPHPFSDRHVDSLSLAIFDARNAADKQVLSGYRKGELTLEGKALDPLNFLKTEIAREITARGYRVQLTTKAPTRFSITDIKLITDREGPYAPVIIWAAVQGKLQLRDHTQPLSALTVQAYYPKFNYSELDAPLFTQSLQLLVKEIASKLLAQIDSAKLSDSVVTSLSTTLLASKTPDNAAQLVYQLGFGQNRNAVPTVIETLQSKDPEIHRASIAALGGLQASEYLPTLIAGYLEAETITEKLITIKAIADIGTQPALAWMAKERLNIGKLHDDTERALLTRTLNLYLAH